MEGMVQRRIGVKRETVQNLYRETKLQFLKSEIQITSLIGKYKYDLFS